MNNITIPWPGWTVVRRIGRGGFGTVYEISRRDQFGYEEKAALKVIRIPDEAGVIDQFRMDGYDNASISARLKEDARKINQEYYLQNQLKGYPNVVRVDENMVTAHSDGLGWDIFIRMELLHPMTEVLMTKQDFSEKTIIKIGKDICEALNVCHKRDIIHRDIKPENIFLSDTGDWKLGDFGIARTMEHSTRATKAGTYNYLAPEVFHGEKYGKQVDIYSLGMVLYWLLNKRRRPFLPVDRPPTALEDEQARIKRFQGIPIPPPLDGSEGLKRIVLKACAYNPVYRYTSAEEMLKDLETLREGQSVISTSETDGSHRAASESEKTVENGWDDGGTIGDPKKFRGQEKESVNIIENRERTQRSVNVGDNTKNDEERIDTPESKTRTEKPCPVKKLMVGEVILIGGIVWMLFGYPPFGYWYYTILLDIHHLRESGHFLYFYFDAFIEFLVDIISRLLLMGGGPIFTIVFWKADRKIFDICRLLIYLNIVVCFSQHLTVFVLELNLYRVGMGEVYMFIGLGFILSILIAFFGGRWMLSEKLTGKKDKTK